MADAKIIPLVPTTEIAFAICSDAMTPAGLAEFKADLHGFLLANADSNVDEGVKLELVNNDDKVVHLALPYYTALENVPQEMSDEDVNVAGGVEVGITVGVIWGGVAIGVTAGTAAGVGAGIGIGTGIAIGAAVAAGVASAAALAGLGVAAAHAGMSLEEYSSEITTTSVGNGQVWKRA